MVSLGRIAIVLGLVCLGEAVSNHKHEDTKIVIDAMGEAVEATDRVSDEDGLTVFEVNSDGHAEVESADNKPLTRRARKEQAEREVKEEDHEDKPHKLLQPDEAPVKFQGDKLVQKDEKHHGPHPNWLVQPDEKKVTPALEQLVKPDEKVDKMQKGAALVQADAKEDKATSGSNQQANATEPPAKSEKPLVRQDANKKARKQATTTVPPDQVSGISLTEVYDSAKEETSEYDSYVVDPNTASPSALSEVAAIVTDTSEMDAGEQDQTISDESTASQPTSDASLEEAATPEQ